MTRAMGRWVLLMACLVGTAQAAESKDWSTERRDGMVIRTRPRADIPGGKDFWAEGELAADLDALRAALKDHEQFRRWMPHVTESRVLAQEPGGSRVTYTQLDLPIVSNRDYVLRVSEEEGQDAEGRATFLQRWAPAHGVVPERRGVVRLLRNMGSWHFTARPEGGVHFVYRFTVEAGGSVPSFLASVGQMDAVVETVRALEKRALALAQRTPAPSPEP